MGEGRGRGGWSGGGEGAKEGGEGRLEQPQSHHEGNDLANDEIMLIIHV